MDDQKTLKQLEQDGVDSLFERVKQGLMSTAGFHRLTGRSVRVAGYRSHSSYSAAEFKRMRETNRWLIKNHKVAANVDYMHQRWLGQKTFAQDI